MQNVINKPKFLTKNVVKTYLDKTGIKDLCPNNYQLEEWGMSKKRFTQIKFNSGGELMYTEATQISQFLKPFFPELQPWHLYDHPTNEQLEQFKKNIEKTSLYVRESVLSSDRLKPKAQSHE